MKKTATVAMESMTLMEIKSTDFASLFSNLSSLDVSSFAEDPASEFRNVTAVDASTYAGLSSFEPRSSRKTVRPSGPTSSTKRVQAHRSRKRADTHRRIAVLDFETDPFDHVSKSTIFPFLAVLYSDQFEPIVIWEEDHERFIDAVIQAIEELPEAYTIYAHNGGSFDYLFFIHRLRGTALFKGRAIMVAHCGRHELRDSLHIIPERLAGYKKDDFDYTTLYRTKRGNHRDAIIKYCINDCRYLFQIVKKFVADFGLKLSIGQAAMAEIKKHYKVDRISENLDAKLRGVGTDESDPATFNKSTRQGYFYGGRVECLAGLGRFNGDYKLYDVNSMYPYVMANFKHPIGREYYFRTGMPSQYTAFVQIECDNFGAFVTRGADGETTATVERGVFFTTIFEYATATRLGLYANATVLQCVDCDRFSSFEKFVVPTYANRLSTKRQLAAETLIGDERDHVKMQDMFYKYLLNNGFGKFAQNPRRFKEHFLTDPGKRPLPGEFDGCGDFPQEESEHYAIWSRPSPERRFNNVGTGASITGAARAVLMEAIHYSIDPIYCDTDSLICRGFSPGAPLTIHNEKLGAWKIEKEYEEILICGKKQYAAKVKGKRDGEKGRLVLKSKGVSGLTWKDYEEMLIGEVVASINKAPTITKSGSQFYMNRRVRATAPPRETSFAALSQKRRAHV
jgi:hypothetical protein